MPSRNYLCLYRLVYQVKTLSWIQSDFLNKRFYTFTGILMTNAVIRRNSNLLLFLQIILHVLILKQASSTCDQIQGLKYRWQLMKSQISNHCPSPGWRDQKYFPTTQQVSSVLSLLRFFLYLEFIIFSFYFSLFIFSLVVNLVKTCSLMLESHKSPKEYIPWQSNYICVT